MLSTLGPRCTGTGVACRVRDTSQEPGRGEGGLLGVRLGVGAGQASQRGLHSCMALCLGPTCGLPALLSGGAPSPGTQLSWGHGRFGGSKDTCCRAGAALSSQHPSLIPQGSMLQGRPPPS